MDRGVSVYNVVTKSFQVTYVNRVYGQYTFPHQYSEKNTPSEEETVETEVVWDDTFEDDLETTGTCKLTCSMLVRARGNTLTFILFLLVDNTTY